VLHRASACSRSETRANGKIVPEVLAMDQEERRKELYALLGELPERSRPINARLVSGMSLRN